MRNENLRAVFMRLGFANVRTVINSGNVLFETNTRNVHALEDAVEKALPEQLGFTSTVIVRSRKELQALADKNPFQGYRDTPKSRLNVTFLKKPPAGKIKLPFRAEKKTYELLSMQSGGICSVIDTTTGRTPELMLWMEKQFGKEITTRTWKTVGRILAKFGDGA